jgi:hypothetical protein
VDHQRRENPSRGHWPFVGTGTTGRQVERRTETTKLGGMTNAPPTTSLTNIESG